MALARVVRENRARLSPTTPTLTPTTPTPTTPTRRRPRAAARRRAARAALAEHGPRSPPARCRAPRARRAAGPARRAGACSTTARRPSPARLAALAGARAGRARWRGPRASPARRARAGRATCCSPSRAAAISAENDGGGGGGDDDALSGLGDDGELLVALLRLLARRDARAAPADARRVPRRRRAARAVAPALMACWPDGGAAARALAPSAAWAEPPRAPTPSAARAERGRRDRRRRRARRRRARAAPARASGQMLLQTRAFGRERARAAAAAAHRPRQLGLDRRDGAREPGADDAPRGSSPVALEPGDEVTITYDASADFADIFERYSRPPPPPAAAAAAASSSPPPPPPSDARAAVPAAGGEERQRREPPPRRARARHGTTTRTPSCTPPRSRGARALRTSSSLLPPSLPLEIARRDRLRGSIPLPAFPSPSARSSCRRAPLAPDAPAWRRALVAARARGCDAPLDARCARRRRRARALSLSPPSPPDRAGRSFDDLRAFFPRWVPDHRLEASPLFGAVRATIVSGRARRDRAAVGRRPARRATTTAARDDDDGDGDGEAPLFGRSATSSARARRWPS